MVGGCGGCGISGWMWWLWYKWVDVVASGAENSWVEKERDRERGRGRIKNNKEIIFK